MTPTPQPLARDFATGVARVAIWSMVAILAAGFGALVLWKGLS